MRRPPRKGRLFDQVEKVLNSVFHDLLQVVKSTQSHIYDPYNPVNIAFQRNLTNSAGRTWTKQRQLRPVRGRETVK